MKKLIRFSFLLFSTLSYSQKHEVRDYNSRALIPYVTIRFPSKNTGFYSNDKGFFELEKNKIDSIYISCLGYKTFKTKANLLNDTIFLIPQTIKLNEIILKNKPYMTKKIGFKKGNTFLKDSTKETLILGFYASSLAKKTNEYINKVYISFNKKGQSRKDKYRSFIRFSIYSAENRLPVKPLIEKSILIELNENSKKQININLEKNSIKFNEKGVFIIVEKIGEVDSIGRIISKKQSLPNLKFSTKKPSGFLDYSTFIFLKGKWVDFNTLNLNMNLALELILANYEE